MLLTELQARLCTRLLRRECHLAGGTGSRSEKIKTYNFKDSRVSDHRTKVNFELTKVMGGDLEACIQACINLDQEEQLAYIAES